MHRLLKELTLKISEFRILISWKIPKDLYLGFPILVRFEDTQSPEINPMQVDWNMNLHSFKETRRLKPIEWIEPKRSAILKHSTFMTSKKWFQRIGGFDESFGAVDMTEIGIVRRTLKYYPRLMFYISEHGHVVVEFIYAHVQLLARLRSSDLH